MCRAHESLMWKASTRKRMLQITRPSMKLGGVALIDTHCQTVSLFFFKITDLDSRRKTLFEQVTIQSKAGDNPTKKKIYSVQKGACIYKECVVY